MVVAVCACHRRQHNMNDKNVWHEINLKQMQNNKCSLIFINFLMRQSDLVAPIHRTRSTLGKHVAV